MRIERRIRHGNDRSRLARLENLQGETRRRRQGSAGKPALPAPLLECIVPVNVCRSSWWQRRPSSPILRRHDQFRKYINSWHINQTKRYQNNVWQVNSCIHLSFIQVIHPYWFDTPGHHKRCGGFHVLRTDRRTLGTSRNLGTDDEGPAAMRAMSMPDNQAY